MTSGEGGLSASAVALLDAVTAISSDLDLAKTLDHLVLSACALTDARYGALGVIGEDGELAEFVHHGIDDDTRARIGALPRGRGVLGLLINDPAPLRLHRLQDHPSSFGFPPNHPPMQTLLGVPIRIRGAVYGNLYLTDKVGGGDFTEQDQALVEALAAAAGFVVDNARTYGRSERQRAWLQAAAGLYDAVRPPASLEDAFGELAVVTRVACDAQAVGVLRRTDAAGLQLVAREGRRASELPRWCEQVSSAIADLADGAPAMHLARTDGPGSFVLAPLRGDLFGRAVLLALVDGPTVAESHLGPLEGFVTQAALTLDRLQAMTEREQLALVSDRERIARDLHDVVIQRLFATGLSLQATRAHVDGSEAHHRIERAVADLDTTIRDIRQTIFRLHHHPPVGLRAAIEAVVSEYEVILGFTPKLRSVGPVDTAAADLADDVLAVLRELLSNVARHARARHASIEVTVRTGDAGELTIRVSDDGAGLPKSRIESGLANIRERSASHGGQVEMHGVAGTDVTWRVPLP